MVVVYWVAALFVIAFPAFGEIKVQAEADKSDHFENLPVPITIIITHPADVPVDESSFRVGGEPVQIEKVRDVGDSSGKEDILSIYRYALPNQAKGLHVLPSFTVRVGGKVYKSVATTFEVKAMSGSAQTSRLASSADTSGAFLKLEAIIDGPTTLYPGQTMKVGYRYTYNANIETTEEVTPLFEPKGFLKVGDKIVDKKQKGEISVLEVTQEVEAQTPGEYTIGPSTIEGYVYSEDSLGRRTYAKNKLKSVVPPVTLAVKPLPTVDAPASFNGAVGNYTFSVALKSPPKVTVGDEMTLLIEVSGNGDLETVKLPELCCQPGMSGVFKLSDLPPVGKVEGNKKVFTVSLRPLTAAVREVPSLEFSFFDPSSRMYKTLHSRPIPVSVAELKGKEELPVQEIPKEKKSWKQEIQHPSPVEVEGNYPLDAGNLRSLWFGSWWMLLFVPVGMILLFYQYNLKRFLAVRKEELPPANSDSLFADAWKEEPHTSPFYAKLYQAFFLRLQERGDIDSSVCSVDKLPAEGAAGDVKALLTSLEEARYAGDKGVKEGRVLDQAARVFKELEVKP